MCLSNFSPNTLGKFCISLGILTFFCTFTSIKGFTLLIAKVITLTGEYPFNDILIKNIFGYLEDIKISEGDIKLNLENGVEISSNFNSKFTVVIDDNGVSREQAVVVDTVNTDDVAPKVESGDSASSVDENSGAGQVVYTTSKKRPALSNWFVANKAKALAASNSAASLALSVVFWRLD